MLILIFIINIICGALNTTYEIDKYSEGIIIYKYRFSKDIDPSSPHSDMLIKTREYFEEVEYTLHFKDGKSLFTRDDLWVEDGIIGNLVNTLTEKDVYYLINLSDNSIITQRDQDGNRINIVSSEMPYKWEITEETKNISGFVCRKAIASVDLIRNGKKIKTKAIAWYAPKIALPFGPKNFYGLPGIVLEASLGEKMYYMASLIEFKEVPVSKVVLPKANKIITEREYNNSYINGHIKMGF